jgi:nitrite reductase (NADH) small subunit
MPEISGYQSVGKVQDFPPGSKRLVQVGSKPVLVFHRENGFLAFEDFCPHRGGPLSEGEFLSSTVQCPWHGSRFDLGTGKPLCGPATQSLKWRTLRVDEGELFVSC